MKSLSMPDHLGLFAQDVAEMEQRLLTSTNHHASKQNEETNTLTSTSYDNYNPVKYEEEGDFFVRGIDIDNDDDSYGTTEEPVPASTQQGIGGYLPSFDYGAFNNNSNSNSLKHSILSIKSLRSSERFLSFETVHEEDDDENQDIELEDHQQNAQAAIAELADLFFLQPRQLHDNDNESNNRTQQKNIHPEQLSPKGVAWNTDSSTSTSQQPKSKATSTGKPITRRSIFHQLVDKYAWRPAPQEQKEENFTRLSHDARAQSLPACRQGNLPRKGSLKRVSSLYSPTNENPDSTFTSLKRNVSFSHLEVREYNIALSDHPSCSYGPPIQLGWDYRQKKSVQVEDYEEARLQQPRRTAHEMVLSYNVRRFLLLKRAGYSDQDLKKAVSEVDRVKRERMVTDLFLPASKLDETMEHVMDHVKTTIFGGGSESRD
jgi:hypothetical protein